ncbi:hypothetical protein, partial [uncultured Gimesia sp.]|uniref:hypothetical protein n=1 Tax=uncultured Gimesia sp. TaxID=1678688 RepID=UPI0030DC5CD1
ATENEQSEKALTELEAEREQLAAQQTGLDLQKQELVEREQALTEQSEQLESLREELNQQKSTLEIEQASKATENEQSEKALTELEAEREQLAAQQTDLEQYQSELDLQKQELTEREQALAEQSEQLESLREELNQQKSTLESEQASKATENEQSEKALAELKTEREQLAAQQTGLEQYQSELDLQKQELTEREEQLVAREQEMKIEKTTDAALDQKAESLELDRLTEQREELEQLRAELKQQQEELKSQSEQLNAQEQQAPEQEQSNQDQQSTLDEISKDKEKLSLDHDQLMIDREEISRQRDNLESQRIQIQNNQGELEDRERIIQLREQELDERESLMAEVGLNPKEMSTSPASETESLEPDSAEAGIPLATGSLLESFMKDSSSDEPETHEEPAAKSGSLLDLFTKNPAPETIDSGQTPGQNSAEPEQIIELDATTEQEDTLEAAAPDDSDSIAAYMEKLLERSRGEKSGANGTSASAQPKTSHSSTTVNPKSSSQTETNSSLVTDSLPGDQSTSASMSMEEKLETLKKAPTHSQDKDAVRDAMNSFRDVANYSARMAIARHSLKHQKTDLVFKGVLMGVCVLTTIIIFAEWFWGANSLGIFKWAALAVSIASIAQFQRGYQEAKRLFPEKKKPLSKLPDQTETVAGAGIVEESMEQAEKLETVAEQTETPPVDTLNSIKGIQEQLEQLSAEEDELQSLEEQLMKSARSKSNRGDSTTKEENQREFSDPEQDKDQ